MIIGIGGVSRSGKTSLAILIKNILEKKGETAIILSQDDYVFPESEIPKIKHRVDWESPESIDFQRFKNDILLKSKAFEHVITEGLFDFYDAEITTLFDIKFFIQIHKNTFLKRKAADKRWGFEPKWFIEHIWKSYLKYGRTILDNVEVDVLVLSGEHNFDEQLVARFLGILLL